jgi:hypothetical protein
MYPRFGTASRKGRSAARGSSVVSELYPDNPKFVLATEALAASANAASDRQRFAQARSGRKLPDSGQQTTGPAHTDRHQSIFDRTCPAFSRGSVSRMNPPSAYLKPVQFVVEVPACGTGGPDSVAYPIEDASTESEQTNSR